MALLGGVFHASAGTSGVLTYSVTSNAVYITDCDTSASGYVEIPSSLEGLPVTVLFPHAFEDCSEITSVFIPSTVEQILEQSFLNCIKLERAVFGGRNPLLSSNVFSNVAAGFKIYYSDEESGFSSPIWKGYASESYDGTFSFEIVSGFPETITITDYPTSETGEVDVPSLFAGLSVTRIGGNAFDGCTQLTRISLPDGIIRIEHDAFFECGGLTTFTVPSSVTYVGDYAFADCGLASIFFEGDAPQGGSDIFDGYSFALYIRQGAQDFASELPWKNYSPVEYVGLYDFEVDREAVKITDYPFDETGVVTIPDTIVGKPVTSLGESAFYNCQQITSLSIPESVTTIGQGTMAYTTDLQNIELRGSNSVFSVEFGVLFNKDKTELLHFPAHWNYGPPRDGNYEIPNTVTSVLTRAFIGATDLYSVTIPVGVSNLNSQAFYQCSDLTAAIFFGDASNMGGSVFDGADASFKIYYSDQASGFSSPSWLSYPAESFDGNYSFSIWSNVAQIDNYAGTEAEPVVLPETLAGFPVRYIHSLAFYLNNATSYSIPEGVTDIFAQAFQSNPNLKYITIPSSVTNMGYGVFKNCAQLKTALFNGDAPAYFSTDMFAGAHGDFTLYYFSDQLGFSSPTWNGYPATAIDRAVYPAAKWLLDHDLAYDTDLSTDVSGDGVDLLMEYALNLNPHENNQGNLPQIFIDTETEFVGITYYGASAGVTYTAETTTNLLSSWTSSGMSYSSSGDMHSAFLNLQGTQQFIRLKVEAAVP